MSYGWGEWPPYVSVGERRRNAANEAAKLRKRGVAVAPVIVEGRKITRTFWGTAWCRNLEKYSDFETRLPRGRSYVRNGLVIHLEIASGKIEALVRGTSTYSVAVNIEPVPKARWRSICKESAGAIDSLVELLQGRFSKGVMDRICQQHSGLFPSPREITFSCSCPDFASMCKHVAAVLYGVGVRLDEQPELLFRLRKVSEHDLIASADAGVPLSKRAPSKAKVLTGADLSELFGLQLGAPEVADASGSTRSEKPRVRKRPRATPVRKKKAGVVRAPVKEGARKRGRRAGGGA